MSRVLIVDDDEPTLSVLSVAVRGWGYEVELGREAGSVQELVRSFKPGLIILDYQLPGVSGAQIFQRLRGTPEGKGLPVVFVSANPLELVRLNVGEDARVRYLPKPLELRRLKDIIEEFLPPPPTDDVTFLK